MNRFSLRTRLLVGVIVLAAAGLAVADVATYSSLRSYLVGQVDVALNRARMGMTGPPGTPRPLVHGDWAKLLAPGDCIQVRPINAPANSPASHSYQCNAAGPRGQPMGIPDRWPARIPLPGKPYTGRPRPCPTVGPMRVRVCDLISFFTVRGAGGVGKPSPDEDRVLAFVDDSHPSLMLLIIHPLDEVDATLHRLFLTELLVSAIVLAALAALALWIIRLGLRPLRAIEATAAAITAGDLSRRVEHVAPKTEVGRVGGALNTMLDRIEASDKRLRRFVADASHELRTPLAAVRAYAELFGRGAADHPDDLERSMTGITREAERMSILVDDLLLLARLDERRPLEREPLDLARLVGEAVDAARVVEPSRPIDVDVEPAMVIGDSDRLRQVIDNLFANVRAHTPPATAVSVQLRREDGNAILSLADRGPGLSDEDAARVFERFYRVDTSRARASGGAGLGLSIVVAVVEAHGGTAAVRSTPGGGATFVIKLPLAET